MKARHEDWGVDAVPPARSDPTRHSRPSPYTPAEVLDKLCDAGLSDINQKLITPAQFKAAMRGERVQPTSAQLFVSRYKGRKV